MLEQGDIGGHDCVIVEGVGAVRHVHDALLHQLRHLHRHADSIAVHVRRQASRGASETLTTQNDEAMQPWTKDTVKEGDKPGQRLSGELGA